MSRNQTLGVHHSAGTEFANSASVAVPVFPDWLSTLGTQSLDTLHAIADQNRKSQMIFLENYPETRHLLTRDDKQGGTGFPSRR
jgi:hypothetical protein